MVWWADADIPLAKPANEQHFESLLGDQHADAVGIGRELVVVPAAFSPAPSSP